MVHDSLVCEASKEHLDTVIALVKRTMEEPQFPGALPIEVEIAVGDTWGTTKPIDVGVLA
jgi:DNA polymerase I-like protein with 3'-5' exonuclease and polymerase domains